MSDNKIEKALWALREYCQKTECKNCNYFTNHECDLGGCPCEWRLESEDELV